MDFENKIYTDFDYTLNEFSGEFKNMIILNSCNINIKGICSNVNISNSTNITLQNVQNVTIIDSIDVQLLCCMCSEIYIYKS